VNDDLSLSLYLDGRLSGEERAAFEARLDSAPALRARLDALHRLQALSAGLGQAAAAFSADDVRVRAAFRPRGWWRLGIAAAAVVALAATHAAVFLAGARRGAEAEREARASFEEAEALLARAAALDVATPHEKLEGELATLRQEIPARLVALARTEAPEAALYADTLRLIDTAFEEQRDAGFLGLRVKLIASGQACLVPAATTEYTRVLAVGDGRYRVIYIDNANETPRVHVDEGTPEELRGRHAVRVVPGGR
jgi:hypothetical protein